MQISKHIKKLLNVLLKNQNDTTYITDTKGIILSYSAKNWNNFATINNGPKMTYAEKVMGHSIFDFIQDREVQDCYRTLIGLLLNKQRDTISFIYRCDAPAIRRTMRLTMIPIVIEKSIIGILYHSITLNEEKRKPQELLNKQSQPNANTYPLLTMCSWCKDVRTPPGEKEGIWISVEDYYSKGGTQHIKVTHGVCLKCKKILLQKNLETPAKEKAA